MRIGFYATLKSPDHDTPSGDRRMARALMAALEHAGHKVDIVSRLRSWAREPQDQAAIRDEAIREADEILRRWDDGAPKPDLVFTYHLYYRAPDWIGPALARSAGIPYAVAEASFAMKRAGGEWTMGHDATEAALQLASAVFALKTGDVPGLRKVPGLTAKIVSLPPFLDRFAEADADRRADAAPGTDRKAAPGLLAIGMMRSRAKLNSYRLLADALSHILHLDWTLRIAGDGPARGEVEAAFAEFPENRIHFLGVQPEAEIARLCAASDLFLWPGIDEAYGMVYLEAQSAGLPVIAMELGGVSNVVVDGVSGRLVPSGRPQGGPSGDAADYAAAIADLLTDAGRRRALGQSAKRFVRTERAIAKASEILDGALARALAGREAS